MKEEHYNLMNKGIVIENPIYPQAIVVYRGDDLEKMMDYYESLFKEDSEWELNKELIKQDFDGSYKGMSCRYLGSKGKMDFIIHLTEVAGTGTICHEAFHAVESIFDSIGIEHCRKTSEAWAYFLAFITKEIVNNLYK